MYTSPKFDSEEARLSVYKINRSWSLGMGIVAMADGSMSRASAWTDVTTSTGGTVQSMGVSSLCSSQSDLQCLGLVTGACASVVSCLNTIGHNVACFMCLLADGFASAALCRGFWLCQPTGKSYFCTVLNAATGGHHALSNSQQNKMQCPWDDGGNSK